jgi:hypothetical protein
MKPMDVQTLDALEQHGAVLTNTRHIRHFLYGARQTELEGLSSAVGAAGYTVTIQKSAMASNWLMLAERDQVVSLSSVSDARAMFSEMASKIRGGEYDGWEASLLEGEA